MTAMSFGHQRRPASRRRSATARAFRAGLLAIVVAAGLGARPASAQSYVVTDLGTLGGPSRAFGLNNLGQVVGQSQLAGDYTAPTRAFLYDSEGIRDLGTLGGINSDAYGINDRGQVVGYSQLAGTGTTHAFLYDSTGMHDLGALGGGSYALAINASGQVLGHGPVSGNQNDHPLLFDASGIHDLGVLPGLADSVPYGINASGQIVGQSGSVGAFLSDGTGFHALGSLGGAFSVARGINDAGQIVGDAALSGDSCIHAFLYDGSGMHDLGTLGHDPNRSSNAFGINSLGHVVGAAGADYIPEDMHAFIYNAGLMLDLNKLIPPGSGWQLTRAMDINDQGQIVGEGIFGGHVRAFLLTPVAGPQVRLSTHTLDFGKQPRGTTSVPLAITLTNVGNGPLALGTVSVTSSWHEQYAITGGGEAGIVQPGESRAITVVLAPLLSHWGNGDVNGALVTITDATGRQLDTVELYGFVTVPGARFEPDNLAFGDQRVGVPSSVKSVLLTNPGLAPLVVRGASVTGPNAAEFALTGEVTGTIAPGESRSIDLIFTPGDTGSRSATLQVANNSNGDPVLLQVTGTGVVPIIRLSPSSLNFGTQAVGSSNGAQAVTIQNTGHAPLSIGSIAVAGADQADFVLGADGCAGGQLQPGDICTLNVRFTPTAPGSRTAVLAIGDDAPGGPHMVTLSGEGIAPTVSVSADQVTFGEQLVGSTSVEQNVTVSNHGTAPLTVYGVSLTGANAGDFDAVSDLAGLTLLPGESRSITLRFRPTAAGSRAAALTLSDSAPGSPHRVALSGTGTAPSLAIGISQLGSPTSVSFRQQAVGTTSPPQTVTLTNSGTAPLVLSIITVTGPNAGEFALEDGSPGTLAPGASRTLTLRFTPLATGSRAAGLAIASNAPGGPQTIALTGTGVVPTSGGAALAPSGAEFSVVAVDGVPTSTRHAVVSVGQSVTFKLLLKYRNGATADVSTDMNVRIFANARLGTFTAKNVWRARPEDSGRTLVFYGRYYSPTTRRPIIDQVVVSVRKVQRMRH